MDKSTVSSHQKSFKSKTTIKSANPSENSEDNNDSYITSNSQLKKKLLTPGEEVKLGNFMKINHFIKNQNIRQVEDIIVEKVDDNKDQAKEENTDKLLIQLQELEKQPLISSQIIYFNNEILTKKTEKRNQKKKKKKQNLNIQSMVLIGKNNNITGLEEKTSSYIENNYYDLDDRLNEIEKLY